MTDADIRWVPGDGWGVVTPRVLVWLDAAAGLRTALAVHQAAMEGATVDALLVELSRRDCARYAVAGLGSAAAMAACGGGGVEGLGPSGPVSCGGPTTARQVRTVGGPLRRAVVGLIAPFEDAVPITGGVVPCSALVAGSVEVSAAAPEPALPSEALSDPANISTEVNPFAELWGHTVRRPVEAAAVRGVRRDESGSPQAALPPTPDPAAPTPVQSPVATGPKAESVDKAGPVAVRLPAGVGRGRVSDVTLLPEAETAESGEDEPEVLGVLVGPGEVRLEMFGSVVVGRAPVSLEPFGQVFKVESPQREVSRSHVLIRPDDDRFIALDLGSNNGTRLLRPGRRPEAVSTTVPTPVHPGDVLDLGDGVTLRLEGPA